MNAHVERSAVAALPVTDGLDADQLDALARCARRVAFREGEHLAREGEAAETFFGLTAGRAVVEVHHPTRGPVVLATLGPGDVAGWSWLFPPHHWEFDVTATEEVEALAFDGEAVRRECDGDPVMGHLLVRHMVRDLSRKLHSTRLQLTDVYRHGDHR